MQMQFFDQLFGKREQRWFDNGAAGARHGKFSGHAVSDGRRIPVLGTTVSREGLAFVCPKVFPETELHLTFTLRERTIPSRVHIDQREAMQAPQQVVHRYFCTFTAIAADDWDAVVRYVENKPEPNKVDFKARAVSDDEFRALPVAVQKGIVDQLVRARRLDPPLPGTVPLIRMQAGTVRDLGEGRTAQDVLIHSRIRIADEMRSYDTRFRVLSSQRVELIA